MNAEQLKQLENELWSAADTLRANSGLKSSEYATPILGLIFLKFADNKYRKYEAEITAEYEKHRDTRAEREIAEIAISGLSVEVTLSMKKHWIEYSSTWKRGPMSFWVHIEAEENSSAHARVFDPPAPKPVPGKGFAVFYVEIDRAILWFSSLAELRVCITTLSQKVLPSNMILTQKRGAGYGPSNHWLNRLPLRSMTWPYRQRVVKYLKTALAAFELQVPVETVKAALNYYDAYRQEIDQAIEDNELGEERLKRLFPNLRVVAIPKQHEESSS